MTKLEDIIQAIVNNLVTDKFTFVYNIRSQQNQLADELIYPVIFLDPYFSEDVISKSLYIEPNYQLSIYIGYKVELDDINSEWNTIKTKAWDAAKEIVIKLIRDTDNVSELTNMRRTDVKNYRAYDVNTCGCLLEFRLRVKDEQGICYNG